VEKREGALRRQLLWRGLSCLLLLLLLIGASLPAMAGGEEENAEPQTVRVGYSVSGSMLYKGENGEFRGYDAIYLYEIARYTNWRYEFVPYQSWGKALEDLEAGKIDLLPTVLKTPEHEQRMLFSLYPMASTKIALVSRPNDTRYAYGNFEETRGARVGIRTGTADEENFQSWAQKHHLSFDIVDYKDRSDMLKALRSGEIDLAATAYSGSVQRFPAIAEFSPQPMYFAVSPLRPELASALDQAMTDIQLYHSSFLTGLQRYTQPDRGRYRVLLSDKEKEYIKTLPVQRVVLYRDNAPYSYEQDGRMEGITVRVLERLSILTGLQFEYVPVDQWDEAYDAIREGKADMIGQMIMNHVYANDLNLRLTTPYLENSMAVLHRRGTPNSVIYASNGAFDLLKYYEQDSSQAYHPLGSMREGLEAIQKGSINSLACDLTTASYYANILHRGDFEMKIIEGVPCNMAIALPKSADPRLGFVLDRSIQYLSDTEMDEIVQQEINHAPISINNILDRMTNTQVILLFAFLAILLLVLIYFVWLLYRSRRLERRVSLIERQNDSAAASLAIEREIGSAQQSFYRYMNGNILKPINETLRNFLRQGAEKEESPLHAAYLEFGYVHNFLMNLKIMNHLASGHHWLKEQDWKPIALRPLLEELFLPFQHSAEKRGIKLSFDLSGVGPEHFLMEKRLFSMMFLRLLQLFADQEEGKNDGLLLTASVASLTQGENRAVLWLFLHAPDVFLPPDTLQALQDMKKTVQKNPRTIYEKLVKMPLGDREQRSLQLHFAILLLLVPHLGGELDVQSSKEKGTEITVDLLLDPVIEEDD
jgi:ABC-type amino acid transport substrate-binding protein